ncbi:MAG: hypothetical protein RL744_529 [Pseudomonadota bacterium]
MSQLDLFKPVGREFESRPTHQYQETLTSNSGGFVFVGWSNVATAWNNTELSARFEWGCWALGDRERPCATIGRFGWLSSCIVNMI